jgi:periplasmic divalent cation tolerance protein
MIDDVVIVVTSCPDAGVADRVARTLVEQGLAACVNQLPPVGSVYRWKGAIERAVEVPLLVKTTRERVADVEGAIRGLHPYELPEILVIPVIAGFSAYLRWVVDETQPPLLA